MECIGVWPMNLRRHAVSPIRRYVPLLPGGSAVVLGIRPRRFGIGPGLTVLVFLKPFSDLIPSNSVAGPVIATIQSKCGEAKSGNNETSHR